MAILKLTHNPEWQAIGGRFLIPVHDELIVEVPFDKREEGARILRESMEHAGDFLPFTISCDIEETFRWYGLSVDDILSFDKPTSMDTLEWTKSNIQWLQCRLFECEYPLPVFKNPDGSKPIGLAAHGVNGEWSPEMDRFIEDYMRVYKVPKFSFLDHIDDKVVLGKNKSL